MRLLGVTLACAILFCGTAYSAKAKSDTVDQLYTPNQLTSASASNTAVINGASAAINLLTATIQLGPCQMFVPHYHATTNEYYVGLTGAVVVNVLGNRTTLFRHTVRPGDTFVLPKNDPHIFYNDCCETASFHVILTKAALEFSGYYDLPKYITDGDFTEAEFKRLIKDFMPVDTLDPNRQFFPLTGSCVASCKRQGAPKPGGRKSLLSFLDFLG